MGNEVKYRYVVGLGEVLWDKTLKKEVQEKSGMSITECLESEELFSNEENLTKKPGGAPANFVYHVGQWLDKDNIKALVVSSVGRDKDGNELNAFLRENGLNEVPQIEGYKTGEVWIVLDEKGDATYDIKEGAYDHIPFDEPLENGLTLQEIAENCCAVCFGSLAQRQKDSRDTIRKFLDATPDDCFRVYDINMRQQFYTKEIIEDSLQKCNVFKINEDELKIFGELFGYSDTNPENLCRAILDKYNLQMLIYTCAEKKSYVFTPDQKSERKTPKVDNFINSVGAGDSFTGSFMAAIINGKSVAKAHEIATKVAAYVCENEGAMPPMPELDVIMAKYE